MGQTIEFIHIPKWGTNEKLRGVVHNANIENSRLLIYIYVEGWWWVKPYETSPFTSINKI